MSREYREVRFERYCDDVIVHAASERQALQLRAAIARRLTECGLELNEHKTRIVYCKDQLRRGSHEHERFTFLGYTFRPRMARSKYGGEFVNFLPAIGDDERKRIGRVIRRWRLHRRTGSTLTDLAEAINAEVACVPRGLLRVQAGAVGAGRGRGLPGALLEAGLGVGSRNPALL